MQSMYCSNVNKKSFQPPLTVIVKSLGGRLACTLFKILRDVAFLSFLASTKLQDICIGELSRQGLDERASHIGSLLQVLQERHDLPSGMQKISWHHLQTSQGSTLSPVLISNLFSV